MAGIRHRKDQMKSEQGPIYGVDVLDAHSQVTEECPNIANHTMAPVAYVARQQWAYKKARRHKVVACPDCGLFVIWVRRGKDEADYGGEKHLYDCYEEE